MAIIVLLINQNWYRFYESYEKKIIVYFTRELGQNQQQVELFQCG